MITTNRKDHIALDKASKLLTSDKIVIAEGEDEYRAGMKIVFKMLGVTTRNKKDKDQDPFELFKKSFGGLIGAS